MGDVKFTAKSDFEKVKKDYLELARHVAKVESENRKLKDTTVQAGRARRSAFGSGALSDLKTYVTQLFSVQAAIGGIRQAFQFAREEEERGLESLRSYVQEAIRLNQIAQSTADLTELQRRRDIYAERYALQPEKVSRVMFAARTESFERDVEQVLRLSQVLQDVEAGAIVAGQLPGLFPKQRPSVAEALNMVFVGARQSRLDFEEVARVLPNIAEGAALAGAAPAETIAIASVMASRAATGKVASLRAKAFGIAAGIDERLRGRGIIGGFEALRDEFTEEERKKFLGESQELNTFYVIMGEELERIRQRREEIRLAQERAGAPESALSQAVRRAEMDPMFTAQRVRDTAQIRRATARVQEGGVESARRAATIDNLMTAMERERVGVISRYAGYSAAQVARFFGAPERVILNAGLSAADAISMETAGARSERIIGRYRALTADDRKDQAFLDAVNRQTTAVEENTRALRQTRGGRADGGVSRAAALAEAGAARE